MSGYSRRAMIRWLAGVTAYLYGRPGQASAQGRPIQLVLDDVGAIVVQYRGQRVIVTPQEIIDALRSGK